MKDSTILCSICRENTHPVLSLDSADQSDIKYLKKLMLCIPNEIWKADYLICSHCISQLDVSYGFLQLCIRTREHREYEANLCESSIKADHFTCDLCGKTFRQKQYLSQHMTKLHINRKTRKKIKREQTDAVSDTSNKDVKGEFGNDTAKEESPTGEGQNRNNRLSITEECNENLKINCSIAKIDCSDVEDMKDEPDAADEECSDNFESFDEFDNHPKKQAKKESKKRSPQKCLYCNEVFPKRKDWTLHIREQHAFEKPYPCDLCDAKYMHRYSLLIHYRKHKNEKPFICATCGKSFISSADLSHHTKIHDTERAYPCPLCDRSFKTHSNLRTHRLQLHLDPADWKFPCNLCDKKFPIRANLVKHLKRHAGIKDFDCHICGKLFVNKGELVLHLNTHSNQRLFKCSICVKDYKNREGLRRHMKVVHDQGNWKASKSEKKYECHLCTKVFPFSNKLQRHIFTHTGEKPFKCDYCQKRFIDNYGRKVHCKKYHNVNLFT